MPILKVSAELLKFAEEKIRIPADVDTTQDMGPCPQCGTTYDGQACESCGYVSEKTQMAEDIYMQQEDQKKALQEKNSAKKQQEDKCPNCTVGWCESCGRTTTAPELMHPNDQNKDNVIGRNPKLKVIPWEKNKKNPNRDTGKNPKKSSVDSLGKDNLAEVEDDQLTGVENNIIHNPEVVEDKRQPTGARMSRFDDELRREAAVPGVQYDQTSNMNLDGPFGLSSQAPTPEMDMWKDVYPERWLDVTNLDAPDIQGGPGSNEVHAEMSPWQQQPIAGPQVAGTPASFEQPGWLPYNTAKRASAVSCDACGDYADTYKVAGYGEVINLCAPCGDEQIKFAKGKGTPLRSSNCTTEGCTNTPTRRVDGAPMCTDCRKKKLGSVKTAVPENINGSPLSGGKPFNMNQGWAPGTFPVDRFGTDYDEHGREVEVDPIEHAKAFKEAHPAGGIFAPYPSERKGDDQGQYFGRITGHDYDPSNLPAGYAYPHQIAEGSAHPDSIPFVDSDTGENLPSSPSVVTTQYSDRTKRKWHGIQYHHDGGEVVTPETHGPGNHEYAQNFVESMEALHGPTPPEASSRGRAKGISFGKPTPADGAGGARTRPNIRGSAVVYDGVEESLYKAYEASRNLRTELEANGDGDFSTLRDRLASVIINYSTNLRTSSRHEIETAKALVKFAADLEEYFDNSLDTRTASNSLIQLEESLSSISKIGTNGNQETSRTTDVRDLDDQAGIFDRQYVMQPDAMTQVTVPNLQPNQLQLADVPDYYNDGGETGYGLAYNYHREPWPNDPTNPALQGYMGLEYQTQGTTGSVNVAAAVQAAKERVLESIELVDRLERLGMVNSEDKAMHIAKFEQMSAEKLAGYKENVDMLEKSGARQPRVAKVASGNNRMPEMGRMTTASSVTRQDIIADDFLMTL